MDIPAIAVYDLSKRYPKSKNYALRRLNLDVESGEVYGFLGPNGAGKSTTIRLLLNFIQPTRGTASILGRDIVKDSVLVKRSIGYLAGEVALYPKMRGRQFLEYMSQLSAGPRRPRIKDLAQKFRVELDRPIGVLSKGNRQKIGIIQAFMHQPEVLVLDEPTSGLDPLMQEYFFELIKESRSRGAAVFVSSHNLSDVRKMCDRIGFIRGGKLIAEQTIADLAKTATQTFDIAFAAEVPMVELKRLTGAKLTKNSASHVTVRVRGDLSRLFAILARHKVNSINQREVDLEEEFLQLYKGRDER